MRYTSLADLINAYHNHELTTPLLVSEDDVSVTDDQSCLFRMSHEKLLMEALSLLGIPRERV